MILNKKKLIKAVEESNILEEQKRSIITLLERDQIIEVVNILLKILGVGTWFFGKD